MNDFIIPFENKGVADRVLEEWDDICKELDIEYCLIFGTCLGMVRERGYIKIHKDIDIYVRAENLPRLSEKLLERGFKALVPYHSGPYLGSGQHFIKDGILLDVSFDLSADEQFLESFEEVRYNGRIYRVPHPVDRYLEHKYGESWRIPWVK